jgi:hypothetical protein
MKDGMEQHETMINNNVTSSAVKDGPGTQSTHQSSDCWNDLWQKMMSNMRDLLE